MKPRVLILCLLVCLTRAFGAGPLAHPGGLTSRAQLDLVKQHCSLGEEPWNNELTSLKRSRYATLPPQALPRIQSETDDARISQENATAAYAQALLWYYTDDETYAKRAVAILNAWANLQAFTAGTEQDRLQAGWVGSGFAAAAEILRLYPGWTEPERQQLREMFRRAFYPQLNTPSFWNGNVDLTQIEAMLAIAVFNDDEQEFQLGLERLRRRVPAYFYLKKDGPRPAGIEGDKGDLEAFWHHPLRWDDGLTQESCRDNGHHAQFGLGSALHAAEIAWNQRVDVYSEFGDRFTAALELLAAQLETGSMGGVSARDETVKERFGFWELGYTHYHARKGLPLPRTTRLLLRDVRPRGTRSSCNLNFETLTHASPITEENP